MAAVKRSIDMLAAAKSARAVAQDLSVHFNQTADSSVILEHLAVHPTSLTAKDHMKPCQPGTTASGFPIG